MERRPQHGVEVGDEVRNRHDLPTTDCHVCMPTCLHMPMQACIDTCSMPDKTRGKQFAVCTYQTSVSSVAMPTAALGDAALPLMSTCGIGGEVLG